MFGKNKDVKETEEFKTQKVESEKNNGEINKVGISKTHVKKSEEVTMDDLVANNTEVWYKARNLELLSNIASTLNEIKEMNKNG